MDDMLRTIEPKSDQLNADDLLGARTLTIMVSKVSILAGDQPVALHYEGDNGKPYKPCKSMRRVVVTVWGPDANLYIGGRMTLYRDDGVMFGGVAVGGIRISHISGIDKERTIALTASRAVRKPYTVRPLVDAISHRLESGQAAAAAGITALEAFWKGLTALERKQIGPAQLDAWKAHTAEHRQQADAGASILSDIPASAIVPFGNTHFDELLSDGRAAATNGAKAFKTWHARLNASDAEMIQPYADGLKKVAAQADALRT
jgi:hypothetical protein